MNAADEHEAVRVVVVDDHPLFLDGMRSLVVSLEWAELVGEAGTAEKALALALEVQPDVIVMDLHLPNGSGIDATRAVTTQLPSVAVLVLTMFDDDDSVFAAMRAGERGYLLKGAAREEVIRAIRLVADGDAVFGPSIAKRILRYFSEMGDLGMLTPLPALTSREREVLDRMASGQRNNEIAEALYLSHKTIRNNISNIFSKLQVSDRAAAVIRAREAGLGRGH